MANWQSILKNEEYDGKKITGLAIIKRIELLKADFRLGFLKYHNYRVSLLANYQSNTILESKDFKSKKAYDSYIYFKKTTHFYSNLGSYKLDRKIIIDFLLSDVVNSIGFSKIDNSTVKEYIKNTDWSAFKRDTAIYYIMEFLKFHKTKNINFKKIKGFDVPKFDKYFANIKEANKAQKEFYLTWRNNYKKGNYIDVQGNLSYIFVFIYETLNKYIIDKNILSLEDEFSRLDKAYGKYNPVKRNLYIWLCELYMYIENYNKAWDCIISIAKCDEKHFGTSRISFQDVLNIKPKCKLTSITGDEFLYIVGNKKSLTNFGKDNLAAISNMAEVFLKDFEKEHNQNIIEYFVSSFNLSNMSESDYKELRDLIVNEDNKIYENRNYKTKDEWFEALKKNTVNNDRNTKILFSRVPELINEIEFPYTFIPQIIHEALKNYLQNIFRKIENMYRAEKGLPKIGEGWISETNLYYEIADAFPNIKVSHHASPSWLGRQHLDIYLPQHKIGIEYQGIQHSRPIDYFGGKENFDKQKKRDQMKFNKCEKNNCHLIYVYPNYILEEVIDQINSVIKSGC